MKKYTYDLPTIICDCGGKYTKHTKTIHVKSKRHRNFMGEECPRKEREKMPDEQRNKDCIGYVVNNKIENLTEEEHLKRKEYIKIKMRECRERKRQASQDE